MKFGTYLKYHAYLVNYLTVGLKESYSERAATHSSPRANASRYCQENNKMDHHAMHPLSVPEGMY